MIARRIRTRGMAIREAAAVWLVFYFYIAIFFSEALQFYLRPQFCEFLIFGLALTYFFQYFLEIFNLRFYGINLMSQLQVFVQNGNDLIVNTPAMLNSRLFYPMYQVSGEPIPDFNQLLTLKSPNRQTGIRLISGWT